MYILKAGLDGTTLNAGQSVTPQIKTPSGNRYEAYELRCTKIDPGVINISLSFDNGKNWQDNAVDASLFSVGDNYNNKLVFPIPEIYNESTIINVKIENVSAATNVDVFDLYLIGRLL